MKILHISDLHIGKTINGYSLIEDQKYYFEKLINYILENNIKVFIIAGDIYDKYNPSSESIELFSWFLENILNIKDIKVFIISGNHDNNKRISYLKNILKHHNIYIESEFKEKIEIISFFENNKKYNFFLLPFFDFYKKNFKNPSEAFDEYLKENISRVHKDDINILISHGFINYSNKNIILSNELKIGNQSRLKSNSLIFFDYVALGHLHSSQNAGLEKIMYSGSILKYSIDEVNQDKVFLVVEFLKNKNLIIKKEKIKPLRDMIVISDSLENILNSKKYNKDDYIFFELDEKNYDLFAFEKIKSIYKNVLSISYKQKSFKNYKTNKNLDDLESTDLISLYKKFYKTETTKDLSKEYEDIIKNIIMKE